MRQLKKLGGICVGGIVVAISGQPGWADTMPVTSNEVNLIPTNLEIKSESSAVEVDSKNFSLIPTSETQTAKDDDEVGVGLGKENSTKGDLLNKGQLLLKTSRETTFSAYQLPPAFNQGLRANSTKILAQTPTQTPTQTTPFPVRPDVLVPNPEIIIQGNPAPAAGSFQPVAPVPPLLPRAIAPPVGDISVSNINAAFDAVDLGTTARVPKLVLKDAPVREVLELLARSAGLNLAFTLGNAGAATGGAPGTPGIAGLAPISLNLENEPVQEVFNYVLALSGLQANRIGRTLFVGTQLPQGVRNIIVRSLRLNQVTVGQAAGSLLAQGAEQQQATTATSVTGVTDPTGFAPIAKITNTANSITRVATAADAQTGGQGQSGSLLLKGLALTTDERLNTITLIGEPRKVELASALLTQLDMRKRQVAVNVKIVDVNLLNSNILNTSFSFGLGNTSIGANGGVASINFGGNNSSSNFVGSLLAQVVSGNAKILTDPTLVLQEGERATVNLSQEVLGGFRTTYQVVNNVSIPTQEPIIKNAGLILDVQVSRIDDNGFVTLNVNPTISAPASSVATPQGTITLLQQRTAQSGQLRLRDGQTLIMSGIIQETDQTTVTKVPILGDIPILGALFRSTNRTNQRNEVIVLLTPQIMDDSNRSSFGYNYNPSAEVRQILQQPGSSTPR
ncbi:secretin and TonB N-terminal domain-containing protein [Crinalium epipsammum]|uniref:secretin and TonB N-terminal domain-containing protein n=1 Tax=Crinalium epipsammum TaxID=241425 RepID=UPI0002DF4D26|nr:secretin and TonB N-terminal domain-containing protein [Crinalium epipsammum]